MIAKLRPSVLRGEVLVPPSKSAGHRAIICAALAKGKSVISPVSMSMDMQATINAVKAMGAEVQMKGDVLTIDGSGMFSVKETAIDCCESGSTLRFLLPIAAAGGMNAAFTGRGRLPERPIGLYMELFSAFGVQCEGEGGLPLSISGRLRAGRYDVPGNISSQYITGLLLALPLLPGDSFLHLTTELESEGYVDMTVEIMREFGVNVTRIPDGYLIHGGQSYRPRVFTVEGDWSQAAFFMSAAVLGGGTLLLKGLKQDSSQGDQAALSLFSHFGMEAAWTDDGLECKGSPLHSQSIDASQIPDLIPALAVTAAFCPGKTTVTNAVRLRMKESDRIESVVQGLLAMGARVKALPDGLEIEGGFPLAGGKIKGYNDHRIVMAFAMAALAVSGETELCDAQSVKKSYPDFWEEYERLGGEADVICLG